MKRLVVVAGFAGLLAAAVAVWNNDSNDSAERMSGFFIVSLFALFARLIVERAPGNAT